MEQSVFRMISQADGLPIEAVMTKPEGKEKAVLQLAHGMSEHKERYLPFMNYLSEHGFLCVMNDHRGHGASVRSKDDLGYFGNNGTDALLGDMHQLTELIRKDYSDAPLFLLGHSMGSLAARCYARKYDSDLKGLIVCGSPSYNPAASLASGLLKVMIRFRGDRALSGFLNQVSTGNFEKAFAAEGGKSAWLSTNVENQKAYDADPLCGFLYTLNGYEVLMHLMQDTYRKEGWKLATPDMPVFFISGSEDPCRVTDKDFAQAVEFMRSVGYKNVESKLYQGMRHEILNETDKEMVWNDVREKLESWL